MYSNDTSSSRPARRRRSRQRGVTMVLVLVTLATATILASAYLASRDNSAMIGRNISSATSARWSSAGGLSMATSIMETERDWRTDHVDGRLIDGLVLGNATINVDVEDIVTSEPPTATSEYLRVRSEAEVAGVIDYIEAVVHAPTSGEAITVDVDLGEFALAAIDSIELTDRSTVTTWEASPAAEIAGPINMTTASAGPSRVVIASDAAAIDAAVWSPSGSVTSVISGDGLIPPTESPLPATVSVLPPPLPVAAPPFGVNIGVHSIVTGIVAIPPEFRFEGLRMQTTGRITNQADGRIVIDRSMSMQPGSQFVIVAPTEIVVWGDLVTNGAEFVLAGPNASLDLFVGGALMMTDTYIGNLEGERPEMVPQGSESYFDPRLINIYSIPTYGTNPAWTIDGTSVIKGVVYAPETAAVTLADTAAIYGRATARELRLQDDAAIFYDPVLDGGQGYTNPDSLLATDAAVWAAVNAAGSLGSADLQSVADLVPADVRTRADTPSESPLVVDVEAAPGSVVLPTPRTMVVDVAPEEAGVSVVYRIEEPEANNRGRSAIAKEEKRKKEKKEKES
ncbi:MAG: hypothetical protein AB8G96_00455 [Phycisphaerales bacterium]